MKSKTKNVRYLDHIQNTSPCKTTYSFTRSSRFQKTKTQTPNKFYDPVNVQNKRATSLGFGRKTNIENKNTADPGLYHIKSSFDVRNGGKSSQSLFGESHQKIYNRMISGQKTPGPGQYNPQLTTKSKFYMGHKLKIASCKNNPSPQHYDITEELINRLSKHKNKRSFRIKTDCQQRLGLKQFDNKRPGPAHYNVITGISIEEILKKNQNRSTFSRTNRLQPLRTETSVGPGSYLAFSAFGQNEDQY